MIIYNVKFGDKVEIIYFVFGFKGFFVGCIVWIYVNNFEFEESEFKFEENWVEMYNNFNDLFYYCFLLCYEKEYIVLGKIWFVIDING